MNDAIEDCANAVASNGSLPLAVLIAIALNRCVHPSELLLNLEKIKFCRGGVLDRLNELMIRSGVTWSELIEHSISRK